MGARRGSACVSGCSCLCDDNLAQTVQRRDFIVPPARVGHQPGVGPFSMLPHSTVRIGIETVQGLTQERSYGANELLVDEE